MPIYSKTPGSLPPSDKFTRKRSLKTLISEQSLLALEPRMLLDAATVATVTDALVPVPDDLSALHIGSNADAELLAALADLEAPVQAAPAAPAERSVGTLTLNALLDDADSADGSSRSEIVFIDSSVPDYEDLIAAARDGMEIVVLDGSHDGLTQIAEYLDGRTDVDAIYILSHGSAGEKVIGSTVLTADNINQFSDVLGRIGASLSDDGDILLYGCSVADEKGTFLVDEIARLTGADVAASDDTTGNAAQGGDWVLEYQSGRVEADLPFADEGLAAFSSVLDAQINLSGKDGWVSVMSGASFDPKDDSQAGSADLDIVGSDSHGVLYTAYDDNGTTDTTDDFVAYRVRLNNAASSTDFGRVILIGIDANADGRIDLFFSIDGRNNARAVTLFDPGTGLNNSPSTTTTSPLPSGWLPNNGVYPLTSSNFSVVAVSSTTDPHWSGDNDLGDDGKTDVFVNFKLPVKDIATVLAIGSPVDRNGVAGPRGADGVDGFTKNTSVRYVLLSQTQPGPINGDLAGVGKTYDKNATFADLGAMTATMTLSDPLAVGSVVQVSSVGDGNLSSSESASVLISGTVGKTVANASWVKITVTDSSNATVVYYVQTTAVTNAEGTWSKSAADLSSLASGTLTVTAELWSTGDGTGSKVAGSSSGLLTATLDKTAPAVTVTSTSTKGTPTLGGTSDLPVGSQITVVIDPDNDSGTSNSITYLTTVLTGGTWSIPVGVATPSSGTVPTNGLTSYAKITVSGTDAAGNTTSVNALNKPTVNSVTTTDTTPDLSGTWTNISGDTLTVTVNGVEYGTGNGLTITSNRWTLTVPTALSVATHNVTAKVTRSGTNAEDATTGELIIVSGQTVTITSSATTDSVRPTLSGGSTLRDGSAVLVRVDTGNDGLSYITYSVTTSATTGEWSLNLSSATPISGTLPTAGISSSNGILVSYTDANGSVSAAQTLTYTAPTVTVSTITSAETVGGTTSVISNSGAGADYLNKMEAPKTVISGTTTAANGTTINLRVVDDNFNVVTGTATVSSGAWTSGQLNLSGLDNGTLTVTATVNGTSVSGTKTVTHDKNAPRIFTLNQASVARNNPTISGISELVSQTVTIDASDDLGTKFSGTTTTDANGTWSLAMSDKAAKFDGKATTATIKVSSTATDTAGNYAVTSTTTHSIAPGNSGDNSTISIASVTADNAVVTDEVASGVAITGTTSVTGATAGTATGNLNVTVTDGNGVTVTPATIVNSSGNWTATLSNAQVQTLANGQLTVMATIVGSVTSYKLSSLSLDSPVLTITDNVTGTADGNVTFTFKFDQNVTGFGGDASDIVVTGGTEGSVTTVSASEYTMTVTPTASSSGDITVTVPAAAGKGTTTGRNNVGSSATQAYNTNAGVVSAPDITISIANQATNAFPTISGTTNLSAGASIEVTIDPNGDGTLTDAVVYDAVVKIGSPNTWTINTESATPRSGTVPVLGFSSATTMTAKATNAYGNSTELVGSVVKSISTDSGSSSSDFITNDDTLSFSGYAKPSTTVDVYVGATKIGSPTSNGSGIWTVDYTGTAISAGDHTLKAVTTVSGDTATSTQTVTIDKTAPTVAISSITDDTGTASDWITKDNQLTFAGTATANASVKVGLSGTSGTVFEVTVVADSSGNWTVNRTAATALPDGTYTLTATATDSAGNTTAPTKSLTVDTSAALTITSDYKSKDTTPVISGTTDIEVGRTITIGISPTNNGTYSQTYTTTVQTGGTWSVEATTALSNGTIGVRATGTDLAGNDVTATKTMVIDTSAPTIAVTTPLDGTGGNGTLDSTEDGAVVIKGTTTDIPVGSTLTITITDGTTTITDTTTVQTGGTWQLSALNLKSMANGTLTVNASYTDSDGVQYVSRATVQHSKSSAVSIDSITNDTGTLFDYITSDQTLIFKGSATATNVITVTLKNSSDVQVFSGTATANSSGIWSYDYSASTLSAGTYTLSAVNGGTTATQTVTIDTAAPAGPVTVTTLTTEDTTPAITGTATVGTGETLTVAVNGVTYTAGDGKLTLTDKSWTLNIPDANALTVGVAGSSTFDGKYEVKASIRDTAGNVLSDSTTKELAIQDTTAPSAPGATLTSDTGSSGTDKVTKTGTVTVSSIESGATWQYSTNGGTSWTTGTGTNFTLAAGTYATDAVRVRQTDAGGNVSAETKLAAITVDQTNPAAPTLALASDTGSSNTDKITSNGQINVTDIETNATWQYTTDGGTTWSTGTGSSFTLSAGTYTDGNVLVRQTDLAGNTGSNASLGAITVDGTAPAAPGAALTTDSGSSGTDKVTNTGTVTVSSIESGATWQYSTNGGTTWTTGTGTSFTLAAGTYAADAVRVRQSDAAGNVSAETKLAAITVDQTNPAAPTLALAADTGSSNTDKITSNGQINVTGIETNAGWQYSIDGGTTWSTGTGSSFTLAAGTYTDGKVLARQTDLAGNTGSNASLGAITVDGTAPTAPTVTALTANSTTPTLTGTATVGSGETLTVVVSGATYTVTPSGGNWSLNLSSATPSSGTLTTLTNGSTYSVTATVTDAAGSATSDSTSSELVIDTTAPAAPGAALSSDTGSSGTDKVTNTGTVTVSSIESGATWQYSTNGGTTWTTGTGTSFTLTAGTYAADAVRVRQSDAAGNVSAETKLAAITVDQTNPAAPTLALAADTGTSSTDKITSNGQINVTGIETNAGWQYSIDGGTTWSTGTGSSFTLAAGTYTDGKVLVRQTDLAGNTGSNASLGAITVDGTAPAAPGAALTTDSGSSGTDKVTKTGTVTVSSIESDATWEYSTNGGTSWTTGTGTTFTLTEASYAADAVRVRQTNSTGTTSTETKLAAITVDQTNPAAPTLALASDTGTSNSDKITSNGQINVTGIETNASWQYSTDGGTTWSTGTGSSFTLAAGTYTDGKVLARQTDLAGNTGSNASLGAITVDGTAPTAPTVTSLTTSSTTPTLTGTATAGSGETLTVTVSGATYTVTPSGGNWSLNLASATPSSGTLTALTNGTYSVTATVTDAAGNSTSDSTTGELVVNTAAPTAPTVTSLTTNNTTPTLSGTATLGTGESLKVTVSGATYTVTPSGGNWSLNLAAATPSSGTLTALTNGTYSVTATVTNSVGTSTSDSTSSELVIDTTAPAAPTVTTLRANSTTPTLTGTATVGSGETLKVTVSGATYTVTPSGGNWSLNLTSATPSSGTLTTLTSGSTYSVTATVTDAAGNATSDSTSSELVIDTTAPAAPGAALSSDTGSSGTDKVTNTGTVTVSSIESGATWQYSTNGGTSWTTGTGTTFTLTAGTYATDAVRVRQTDTGGNVSAETKMAAITVDQTLPAAPTLALAADTGTSNTDKITSNGQINVTGIETNATWEYTTDGSTWNTGSGSSFTLAAGTYADGKVLARQTDLAGNTGSNASLGAITVDGTAPAAPGAALTTDSGSSGTDKVTKTGTVTVSSIETGATWQYSTNGGTTWTTGTGTTFTLTEASYAADAVRVRQTSSTGTTGAETKLAAITVDQTNPAAPTLALAADTGTSNTDKITSNGQINVTGIETNATWQYTTDGSTWTTGTGTSFTLAAGTYTSGKVLVRQTDLAGNTGSNASLGAITVDGTAPAAPGAALTTDSGSSTSDAVTKTGTVTVSSIESGATWEYSTNGGTSWTTGTGTTFTLTAGTYATDAVRVRQTDTGGNVSAETKMAAITVDQTLPAAPTLALAADTGTSNTDKITSNGQINVTGIETNATWEYTTDGSTWNTGSGSSFTLAAGTYTSGKVLVRQTDLAGNTGDNASLGAITVDGTAPAAPGAALTTDSGSSGTDKVTKTGTVTVSSIESGATWEYSTNGGTSWTTGTGTTFTLTEASYAADAVRVRQTNSTGTTSTETKLAAITVDQTNPAAPTLALAADTGTSNTDKITSNGQINVTGIETNASWQYTTDGGTNWSTGTGSSFTLSAGTYTDGKVLVRQTDLAGNTGSNASLGAITVDGTAPAAPGAALTTDSGSSGTDKVTKTGTVTVSSIESGATWQYSTNGGTSWTTGTGTTFTLTEASYAADAVRVRQTSSTGTTGAETKLAAITVDQTNPAAPTLALAADTGTSSTDKITSNGQINVTGIETNASWQYTTDGGTNWSTGTGSSFTLAAGTYTDGKVLVRQTDLAGNTGSNASLGAITVDGTAPAAPGAALTTDSGSSGTDKVTKTGTVTVSSIETGATWQYSTDGGTSWTTGTGTTFTLAAGTYATDAVRVRQSDAAGNVSAETKLAAITVDQTNPAAPTLALASDTGSSSTDKITSNGQINVTGIETNASWQYTTDGGTTWSTGTSSSFTLAAGTYADGKVLVRQTDLAGNTGDNASLGAITVDGTAPAAPTVTSRTTNDTTPTLTGTATVATGETLTVQVNGVTYSVGTDLTHNSTANTWSLTIPNGNALSAGTYSVIAKVTNNVGTSTSDTTSSELVIDTTAPSAPSPALNSDTDTSGADSVTKTTQVNVTGLESNSSWEYSIDSGSNWNTGTGTSFTLAQGSYAADRVQVRQTDQAGNVSGNGKLGLTVIDTTAPAIASAQIDGTSLVLTYTETAGNLAGTTPAASDFSVTRGSANTAVTITGVSVNASAKTITLTLGTALTSTDTNIKIGYTPGANKVQDIAGNEAAAFSGQGVGIATRVAALVDFHVNGVSYSTNSGLTGLTGDAGGDGTFNYRPGDTVTFSIGNVRIARFSADVIQGSNLFLQDIAGVSLANVNSNYVENMAIFLQALDSDLQDSTPTNGTLKTNDIQNAAAAYATKINITAGMRNAFASYVDPRTSAALDILNADKKMISNALAHVNVEFTSASELQTSGNNVFETIAMKHVADTIKDVAGDRAPQTMDARRVDTLDVPAARVQYNYNNLSGEITFNASDLLANATGKQVHKENLVVSNVQLGANYTGIGKLENRGNNKYAIVLNSGINQYNLEGLSIDYRVSDWTVFTDVTSKAQDTYKSHLSAVIGNVSEGDAYNTFTLKSDLTFNTDTTLKIDFTSELLSSGMGFPVAEYADDYRVPIEYSNDGGTTWQTMKQGSVVYNSLGVPRPVFHFTLEAGKSEVKIRVPIFDDAKVEDATEYFHAKVMGDNVYEEVLKFGIADNDSTTSAQPQLSVNFIYVGEGEGNGVFTVSLSKASAETITVEYYTADLGTTAGQDYTHVSGTLTFSPGQTSATISVPVIDDALLEKTPNPELLIMNLVNPVNAVLADGQGSLRIFDNDDPDHSPVINAPGSGDTATVQVDENKSAVTTVAATDADAGDTLRYTIVGGADRAEFTLGYESGALAFTGSSGRNYESGKTSYVVKVMVADSNSNVDFQTITVNLRNLNDNIPIISSNGGSDTAKVALFQGTTAVTTVAASDADNGTLTYSISGGADAASFKIDAGTGALAFTGTLDLTAKSSYAVTVQSSDGVNTDSQALTVDFRARPTVNTISVRETTPTISGTATVGSGDTLTVQVNGVTYSVGRDLTYNSATKIWSLAIPSANALTLGAHQVVATVTDSSGKTGADTTANELEVLEALPIEQPQPEPAPQPQPEPAPQPQPEPAPQPQPEPAPQPQPEPAPQPQPEPAPQPQPEPAPQPQPEPAPQPQPEPAPQPQPEPAPAPVPPTIPAAPVVIPTFVSPVPPPSAPVIAITPLAPSAPSFVGVAQAPLTPVLSGVRTAGSSTPGFGLPFTPLPTGGNTGGNGQAATQPAGGIGTVGTRPAPVSLAPGGSSAGGAALMLGIDPESRSLRTEAFMSFNIPQGTFVHSDASASVTLEAALNDGAPLPGWLAFDEATGTFSGTPPAEFEGVLMIRVVARDSNGAEATARFEVEVTSGDEVEINAGDVQDGDPVEPAPQALNNGKAGVQDQIALVAKASLMNQALGLLDSLFGLELAEQHKALPDNRDKDQRVS